MLKTLRLLVFAIFINFSAMADFQIIRDAETEEVLTSIIKKIFKVAGLRPESAHVFIINSVELNAFTVGNGYIFINSGLILRYPNPLHLTAILCHEVGHMAAGHITRRIAMIQERSRNFGVAALAGILGGLLGGGSTMAIATLLGYAETDIRMYLRFSRDEELAADALAAEYLKKLGYGADILIEAFYVFQNADIINAYSNIPDYVSTHPKTPIRINALNKHRTGKKYTAGEKLQKSYKRVLMKLRTYLNDDFLHLTATNAPLDDYSRAIQFHKFGRTKEAIKILEELVKKSPQDVYYRETLAQTFYEDGQLQKSINLYKDIYKVNDLIAIDYANVLIEANQHLDLAVQILESRKDKCDINIDIFRLLAKAYGKQKKYGKSYYNLAYEQVFMLNYESAYALLQKSLDALSEEKEGSKGQEDKRQKFIKNVKDFMQRIKRELKRN